MGLWLPNNELTKEEYWNLQKKYFDFGGEATITRDGDFAIKIFKDNFGHVGYSKDEIEEVRENKFQKIITIASMKNFDNELVPIETYSYCGKFVAYKMAYLKYLKFDDLCLKDEEILNYLKLVRDKLLQFHELGIIYGDVKDDNIFVDLAHQKIILGDIDNMKVGERDIDIMSSYAENFVRSYGKVDEKLDSYMMNLMTLYQLHYYTGWYNDIIENLEAGFISNQKLSLPKNKRLVREMGSYYLKI